MSWAIYLCYSKLVAQIDSIIQVNHLEHNLVVSILNYFFILPIRDWGLRFIRVHYMGPPVVRKCKKTIVVQYISGSIRTSILYEDNHFPNICTEQVISSNRMIMESQFYAQNIEFFHYTIIFFKNQKLYRPHKTLLQ